MNDSTESLFTVFKGRLFQFRIVRGKKDCCLSCKLNGSLPCHSKSAPLYIERLCQSGMFKWINFKRVYFTSYQTDPPIKRPFRFGRWINYMGLFHVTSNSALYTLTISIYLCRISYVYCLLQLYQKFFTGKLCSCVIVKVKLYLQVHLKVVS